MCLKEEYAARVAQDLRRLPSLLRQHHRLPSQNPSLHLETDLVQLDSAHLLNATDPGIRLCWTHCPRCHPNLRDRKREGPSLVVAGPTPKLPRLNLQTLSSVLGAEECALAIQRLTASFTTRASRPLKAFQRMLGLMASTSPVLQLGLLRMWPLQRWLKPRVPSDAWHHGRL